MNKKGFTTIELILTMGIVVVIMATITSVTYTYRDRSNYEELQTDAINYKNHVTKIIYDDILDVRSNELDSKGKVVRINQSGDVFQFITSSGTIYNLSIIDSQDKVGIKYGLPGSEVEYIIPDSSYVTFNTINLNTTDPDANFYRLDISFKHKNLKDDIELHFIASK